MNSKRKVTVRSKQRKEAKKNTNKQTRVNTTTNSSTSQMHTTNPRSWLISANWTFKLAKLSSAKRTLTRTASTWRR